MHTFPEYAPRGDAQVAELARHNPFGAVISTDHGVADRYRMLISSGAATWARSSSAPPPPLPARRREAEPSRARALAGHLRPGRMPGTSSDCARQRIQSPGRNEEGSQMTLTIEARGAGRAATPARQVRGRAASPLATAGRSPR